MIKSLSLIVVIMAFASLGFAQGTGYDGKPPNKEQKKLAKEAEKNEKQRQRQELRERTVELLKLKTFPRDYLGRSLRVQLAILDDLTPYNEDGKTYYFFSVTDYNHQDTYTLSMPSVDSVAFAAPEDIARALTEKLKYGHPVGDVWFQLYETHSNAQSVFYIAKVNCIVFAGLKSITVGTCQ
jgi:hypothetical protein